MVAAQRFVDAPKLKISGINRAKIPGSFMVSVWAKTSEGMPDRLLHTKAVLSRWDVEKCGNCQSHLEVKSIVHLTDFDHEEAIDTMFYAKIHTREKPEGERYIAGREIPITLNACRAVGIIR